MLFNLFPPSEDPSRRIPTEDPWHEHLAAARVAGLQGRLAGVRKELRALQKLPQAGDGPLKTLVELESARHPASPRRLGEALAAARGRPGLRWTTVAAAVALSEQQLQVIRGFSSEEVLASAPAAMVPNRLDAVAELGPEHPAVGLVEHQLAQCRQYLGDLDAALGHLERAHACFAALGTAFQHETSEVLLTWGNILLELGHLGLAEGLLREALALKGLQDGELTGGIAVGRGGRRVPDVPGIAKGLGVLGKLHRRQGRIDDALTCYTEDARYASRPRDVGVVTNRIGELYLEAGAFDLALRSFTRNAAAPERGPLNTAHALLGAARARLTRSIPIHSPRSSETPRQVRILREARELARGDLARAREVATSLRDPGRSDVNRLLDEIAGIADGHEALDRGDLETFEEVRTRLLRSAERSAASGERDDAVSTLWDVLRLELWSWRGHGYVPEISSEETCRRLLDHLERLGSQDRLTRLQEWAERVGYEDFQRLLLQRYVTPGKRSLETREMTIVFGDIRGFSEWGKKLAPGEVADLLTEFFRTINPIIIDHGGRILRYEGDSILAAFNLDGEREDHATDAVRGALAAARAVGRFDRVRRGQDPGVERIQLPMGIHTGATALAHLAIPGRREVTVHGEAVNGAAKLQKAIKTLRGLPEHADVVTDLLVSGETLARTRAGAFRHFRIDHRLPSFPELEPFALAPAVDVGVSFVGRGTDVTPSWGRIAVDVGNRATAGVIDHHHRDRAGGCAASLVLGHPEWVTDALERNGHRLRPDELELVVHAEPDFDATTSAYLVLEILRGRLLDERGEPRAALRELVKYAERVDYGLPEFDPEHPEGSPYVVLTAVLEVILDRARAGELRRWEVDRAALERGLQVIHHAVRRWEAAPTRSFGRIFEGDQPLLFEPEFRRIRDESKAFRADIDRAEVEELAVPRRDGDDGAPKRLRGAAITDPRSVIFKDWARAAGYEVLCVEYPHAPAPVSPPVPRSRFVISVPPRSGLTLLAVARELERLEKAARQKLLDERCVDLVRRGKPREGFDGPDPWYDGRSDAHTIVDAPRSGSVLSRAEVQAVMRRLLPPELPHESGVSEP